MYPIHITHQDIPIYVHTKRKVNNVAKLLKRPPQMLNCTLKKNILHIKVHMLYIIYIYIHVVMYVYCI